MTSVRGAALSLAGDLLPKVKSSAEGFAKSGFEVTLPTAFAVEMSSVEPTMFVLQTPFDTLMSPDVPLPQTMLLTTWAFALSE